jgi:hypothetical protein
MGCFFESVGLHPLWHLPGESLDTGTGCRLDELVYVYLHQPGLDPVSVIIFIVFALVSPLLTMIYLANIHPTDKHLLGGAVL